MRRTIQSLVILLVLPAAVQAAELAILRNGNSIRHERRQIVGSITRLYLSESSSGYIEIPTDQIERFEVDTAPPPLPAPSQASNPRSPMRSSQTALPSVVPQRPVPGASPLDTASLGQVVNGAGEKNQIDPDFINSVIRAESGFNSRAVSKKGAQGLMQLMPQTASQLGVQNSLDPKANVEGGTKYLRELLEKYNYDVPKALAAYNAGSRRVDQYRGVPPYFETQTYVARIIRDFNRKKIAQNPALAKKAATGKKTTTATPRPSKPASRAGTSTQKPKTAVAAAQPAVQERASR